VTSTIEKTPPGWYPDPGVPGMLRFWDGGRWTSQVRRAGAAKQAKLNGLTLTWSYLGACSVPIVGYVAGVMAFRRGQGGHAVALCLVATVSLLAYMSAVSASTY